MLVFDDIKVEIESQGFKGTRLGTSPQKDKTVMFLESMRSTDILKYSGKTTFEFTTPD